MIGDHWDQTLQISNSPNLFSLWHALILIKDSCEKKFKDKGSDDSKRASEKVSIAYSNTLERVLNLSEIKEKQGEFISLFNEYYIISIYL